MGKCRVFVGVCILCLASSPQPTSQVQCPICNGNKWLRPTRKREIVYVTTNLFVFTNHQSLRWIYLIGRRYHCWCVLLLQRRSQKSGATQPSDGCWGTRDVMADFRRGRDRWLMARRHQGYSSRSGRDEGNLGTLKDVCIVVMIITLGEPFQTAWCVGWSWFV